MKKTTTKIGGPRKRLGERLIAGATQLRDALAKDEKIEQRFTVRTVQLDLQPQEYRPNEVRETREMLGVSQAIFAQILAVSVKLVQALEQGTNRPSGPVRRLLDEIRENPKKWIERLNKANVSKGDNLCHH